MFNKILSGTLLIAGTTIGAGMLGIPLLTAKAGFLPAIAITTAVWLFMLATGYLYLEVALWMPVGSNILSMSRRFLGVGGKLAAGGTFLFLYYCLMVAYFAAGAPLFITFLDQALGLAPTGIWGYLSFGVVFGGIIVTGMKLIDRINYLLMTAMFLSYFALVGGGGAAVSWDRFADRDLKEALFAAPILFSAFGYHNVIPSLVTYFDRNVSILRRCLFWGTSIPFGIYLIWQWLIIGAVPLSEIEETLSLGLPATAALQNLAGHSWMSQMGQFFAFFALITSMLGVAFSMVDFLGDGLKVKPIGKIRVLLTIGIFFPPFILSVIDPSIFVSAISFAGGFGEAFLNGLLPVMLVWVGRYVRKLKGSPQLFGEKKMLILLFGLGTFVMLLEAIFMIQK